MWVEKENFRMQILVLRIAELKGNEEDWSAGAMEWWSSVSKGQGAESKV
jgi:hypothetical protein